MSSRNYLQFGLPVLLAAAVAWCIAAPLTAQVPGGGQGEALPPPQGQTLWLGSASCAASACHGSEGVKGQKGCEFNNWMSEDKHRFAYSVLLTDRSKNISRNYYQGLGKPYAAPHEDALCLNCHVHQDYAGAQRAEQYTSSFGVGCESCHGPAGTWLDRHYRPEWQALPIEEKKAQGWKETRDLTHRADSCIRCHVGAPGSEVNHDLLGAGHPRLNFEFGAYHASMPHHWNDKLDRQRNPYLEAQAWQIGQLKTAEAAMKLLAHRAANGPWPEFAEYDCYACHHDLKAKSWRQNDKHYEGRKIGSVAYNGWYTSMLPYAFGEELPEIATLKKQLSSLAANKADVGAAARSLAQRLGDKAASVRDATTSPRQLLDRFDLILRKEGPKVDKSWDEAAQVYMALAAQHQAWTDLGEVAPHAAHLKAALLELGRAVGTPETFAPETAKTQIKLLSGNRAN